MSTRNFKAKKESDYVDMSDAYPVKPKEPTYTKMATPGEPHYARLNRDGSEGAAPQADEPLYESIDELDLEGEHHYSSLSRERVSTTGYESAEPIYEEVGPRRPRQPLPENAPSELSASQKEHAIQGQVPNPLYASASEGLKSAMQRSHAQKSEQAAKKQRSKSKGVLQQLKHLLQRKKAANEPRPKNDSNKAA